MKVKDIANKIRIVGTEVAIRERFKTIYIAKTPLVECEYLERTVLSFQPVGNKIEIFIKPLDY